MAGRQPKPTGTTPTAALKDRQALGMEDNPGLKRGSRGELLIAIAMAVVLAATALAGWRTSDLGSRASDAERQGLIEAIKAEDLINVDWRQTYEEATHAQRMLITAAEVEALEASGDPALEAQGASIRAYLLPSMALLAGPLATDPSYAAADGSLDLAARFNDLQAQNPGVADLDPEAEFLLADRYHAEQRWHVVGAVLLAMSLFWLGLAEIMRDRLRIVSLVAGLMIFLFGLAQAASVRTRRTFTIFGALVLIVSTARVASILMA